MKTRPVIQREEDDLFLKVFYGLLGLIFTTIRYLGRRALQNPFVGLLYLVIAGPAAFLIVQDVRLLWATATARPFAHPPPVWPLSEPLQAFEVALLMIVMGGTVAVDRWAVCRATGRAKSQNSRHTPPQIEEWVLGRAYSRTWKPDPGEFQLEETDELYILTEDHLRTHMIVVAPPGGGKTHSVLRPALHLFKRTGAAVICIDAKARADFDTADFHLNFNPDDPRSSMRLNVWSGRTPREMGERLGEALVPDPGTDKRYFADNAKDTIGGLAAAYHAAYNEMPSLKQLLAYLRDPRAREDLAEELVNRGLPENSEEMQDLRRINQLVEQKNDVLGSLDTTLAPLARGEIAELLTTGREGYSIEQLLREPVRVRFALSVGERPRIAPLLGRLILAQFTHAVISPECNNTILKAAIVDEAHNFVTPAIAKGMAMARENRGCFILAMQDLSQIENPTLREDILSVAGNKMVMAGVGDFDARKFSALFGSRERLYTTHSQGTSYGKQSSQSRASGHGGYGAYGPHPAYGGGDLVSGSLGGGGMRQQSTRGKSSSQQQSEGSSIQVRERAEFLTSEIRGLPRFHAIIERRDNRGEVTPATVVHLDWETITDALTMQSLALYRRTGNLDGAAPRLPVLKGRKVPRGDGVTAIGESAERMESSPQGNAARPQRPQPGTEADAPAESPQGSASPKTPEWVGTVAQQVAARLGISEAEADELTLEAYRKGRDRGYVIDNLEYAAGAPNAENSAELFRFLIRSNQHRQNGRGVEAGAALREAAP